MSDTQLSYWERMAERASQQDGVTLFAEFDERGALLAASPEFLTASDDAALATFLAGFAAFDGDASAEARAAAVGRWRDDGAAIEARGTDERWRLLSSHPTAGGGRCLLAIDITPAKARDAMARALWREHPLPIWIRDAETGALVFANARARRLFDVGEDYPTGQPGEWSVGDFFVDADESSDVLRRLKERGHVENMVRRARSAMGREFWISGAAALFRHEGRTLVVSVIQDVTTLQQHASDSRRGLDLVQDALRSLSVGFALFDDESRLVVCNDRYRELNDAVAEFLAPGMHWETQLRETARRRGARHAQGRENVWLHEVLELSERFEDFEIERADGVQIAMTVRPTSLGGFIVTQDDVTERRAAARLARDGERMLSKILQASPANLCLSRIGDGEIIYQSPSCARLFGADASAKTQFADRGDRADFLTELLPAGAVDNFAAQARAADGQVFPALFSARLIEFNGEEVMVSTVVDLTEQVTARDALRDANARLRDAIEALDEGFALYDADGRLVIWNQIYAAMAAPVADSLAVGASHEALVDASLKNGRLTEAAAERLRDLMRHGPDTAPLRLEDLQIGGGWYSISRNATSDGGVVVTRLDVTGRRRAEEKLTEQRELLHQSEKLSALGELLAGVAHELNNPLSVVVGHAMMLEEEAADDAMRRRAEKIGKAAERCSRIVKTFLAMARQKPAKLERTDVNAVIETALDVAAYGLRSSGARVELALEATPPISADADQLAQVFANLVVNAEHALKDRGPDGLLRIKTKAVRAGSEVRVVVRDNGPGIPPAIRARIFEPFFTTKGVGEGTGVGLAYCHRIVEAHGGRITVGVAPQGGAQFTMHFPTITGAAAEKAAEAAPSAAARGRALVVDDEADVAELFATVLSAAGFEVETAASAEDAIGRLPGDYKLILCDLNMPGCGGRGLFDAIQAQWPELEVRIGFVTGDTMSGGVEAFLRASGRPYLEKPATPADIRRLAFGLAEPQSAGAAR